MEVWNVGVSFENLLHDQKDATQRKAVMEKLRRDAQAEELFEERKRV